MRCPSLGVQILGGNNGSTERQGWRRKVSGVILHLRPTEVNIHTINKQTLGKLTGKESENICFCIEQISQKLFPILYSCLNTKSVFVPHTAVCWLSWCACVYGCHKFVHPSPHMNFETINQQVKVSLLKLMTIL